MATNALDRFKQRLSLVTYYRHIFGVADVHDPRSVETYHKALADLPKDGYDAQGRSYVFNFLKDRVRGIEIDDLIRYDENVRRHTQALNAGRTQPITLKYFQVLAALSTEHYLDWATNRPQPFLESLNVFVQRANGDTNHHIDFPLFVDGDLEKLAFWMATGSGKTLLLHLNYYQYLHYRSNTHDNILLVTPNEGLSQQHMAEMEKSGIPCRYFNAGTADLFSDTRNTVKVIEITKLVDVKAGEGKSVEVSSLEGRNLVFVDEGHKGASSDAQTWRSRRQAIAADGFTFEYSATFGQAVGTSGNTEVEEEYGKAILIDYSYPRFYEDGYGKDYRILNLENDLDPNLTDHYLLANLLTFYEQMQVYRKNEALFLGEFNVAPPLLMFVGHSVTAGKTRSQLSKNDKLSLSDVQELVLFLHRILHNADNWVPRTIDALLSGDTALRHSDGEPIFKNSFNTLRGQSGVTLYADLRHTIFHADGVSGLELVNIKGAEGEIALRTRGSDRFFGLINIGDDANFLALAEKKLPDVQQDDDQLSDGLFKEINRQDSTINILLGAKKFIEGWDSWRVSTMGLLNIGRGEGPEIIQLFGRGVRLLGWNRSLKRSSEIANLEVPQPATLPLLETLNIFGVRADYMVQFRDYLTQEGIDTDEREIVTLFTQQQTDFAHKGLLVIRPKIDTPFEEAVDLLLCAEEAIARQTEVDLHPRIAQMRSPGLGTTQVPDEMNQPPIQLDERYFPLLDWWRIYHDVWQFRTQKGYRNITFNLPILKSIIEGGYYRLYAPESTVKAGRYSELSTKIEPIVTMLLCKYLERFYSVRKRQWEQEQLEYVDLKDDDAILLSQYEAHVRRDATVILDELRRMQGNPALYTDEAGLPKRVYIDRSLYVPLIVEHDTHQVSYSPPALNPGERTFVENLRTYLQTSPHWLPAWEVYLLRNPSRGHGVGFLAGDQRYFPDFILWLKGQDKQHIVFIDPHGLLLEAHPDHNPRVALHREIKTHEDKLNTQANRSDVVLHSYIVSESQFDAMALRTGLTMDEFNQRHVYFPDQVGYLRLILTEVLSS
ncbi:MAG: DEAD/DEAH box helicase family protein [Caldilineaceae bacterium]|nr:DEAD/DEAH box helicase family protein [Caldilineaceae bacterium]